MSLKSKFPHMRDRDIEEVWQWEDELEHLSDIEIYELALEYDEIEDRIFVLSHLSHTGKLHQSEEVKHARYNGGALPFHKFKHQQCWERIRVGERLAEARLWVGLTRKEMAKALNIGMSGYKHYESGRSFLDLHQIIIFQRLTSVDLNWLIRTENGVYYKKYQRPPTRQIQHIRLRMAPTNAIFGKRLVLLRKRFDLTRKEMGFYLHVGERAYGYYEQGHRFMSLNQLVKLRMSFGVDLNDLFACKRDLSVKFSEAPYFRTVPKQEYISI